MRLNTSQTFDTVTVTKPSKFVMMYLGAVGGSIMMSIEEAADLRNQFSAVLPVSDSPVIDDLLRALDAERAALEALNAAKNTFDTQSACGVLNARRAKVDRIRASLAKPAQKVAA